MTATAAPVEEIAGLARIESTPLQEMMGLVAELNERFTLDEANAEFCVVQSYVDAPPAEVFDYMADVENLAEWTYSLRDFRPTDKPGQFVARDAIGANTDIYTEVITDRNALTVDYHCAWDQGEHLWMVYLNRIVDAQLVLDKPGSVVFWQNCRHPFYGHNPFPQTAPADRPIWVGDFWNTFYAGHTLELRNLKRIVEHRHAQRADRA